MLPYCDDCFEGLAGREYYNIKCCPLSCMIIITRVHQVIHRKTHVYATRLSMEALRDGARALEVYA